MSGARNAGGTASSNLAIGVATAFIAFAALLSFIHDPADEHAGGPAGWHLRGTIAPPEAGDTPARLPAAPKRA